METQLNISNPVRVIVEQQNQPKKPSLDPKDYVELIKWFLGTFVFGFVGLYFSNKYKETEIQLKRMDVDANLISAVSSRFDSSEVVQYKYLSYIQPFISTDSLRKSVVVKLAELYESINSKEVKKTEAEILQATKKQTTSASKYRETLTKLEKPKVEQPIKKLDSLEKVIVGNSTKTNVDSLAIARINETKEILTPKKKNRYTLMGTPQTLWCKAGYYVEFQNAVRVGVDKVQANSAILNVKSILKDSPIVLQSEKTINKGDKLVVWDQNKDYQYEIELSSIAGAGRNPFTKAAYITVTIYKKDPETTKSK